MKGAFGPLQLSWFWALSAGLLLLAEAAGRADLRQVLATDPAVREVFYARAHSRLALSFSTLFALFAAVYVWIESAWGKRYSRRFGAAHFGSMVLGALLIFAPQLVLRTIGAPHRYSDYPAAFATWGGVSIAGYGFCLAGLCAFTLVFLEGPRRSVIHP